MANLTSCDMTSSYGEICHCVTLWCDVLMSWCGITSHYINGARIIKSDPSWGAFIVYVRDFCSFTGGIEPFFCRKWGDRYFFPWAKGRDKHFSMHAKGGPEKNDDRPSHHANK